MFTLLSRIRALPRLAKPLVAFALLAALLGLAACNPGGDLTPLPETAPGPYHLGAGDQIRIITFGEEQLTGEFRVSDSGMIAVPLLGLVKADGRTSNQLAEDIADLLRKKNLYKDPSVSVEVVAYRPFYILGEVAKPGEYPYQPGMTVLTAVAVGGGFTYRAIDQYASIVRTTGPKAIEGKAARQTIVQPGDVVTVFERRF